MKYTKHHRNFYRPRHKVIYKISHISGHFYIGQSKDFSSRIGTHISNILLGKHCVSDDTDVSHYIFSILQNCDDLSDKERLQKEKEFIKNAEDGCMNKTYR